MQPWRLASDGRFHHLVLVEKALDARQRQAEAAARREKTREKLRAFREKSVTVTERLRNHPDAEGGNGYVTPLTWTGTRTGKRKNPP